MWSKSVGESTPVSKSSGEHKDYYNNLKFSQELVCKEDTGKLNGLRVKICDSEHLKKALFIISWAPGNTVKRGNYATPVFLHQYSDQFKKTAQNVLTYYKKAIQDREALNPLQPEFLPTNLKV